MTSCPLAWLESKSEIIISYGKDVEKSRFTHCWWEWKMVHSFRKTVFDSSSKKWFKHKPSDPVITFIGKIKRKENKYSIHILPAKNLVHKSYGGIIHNSQKVKTIQMSTDDRQINKMWHIHTMEYYSDIKKNKY